MKIRIKFMIKIVNELAYFIMGIFGYLIISYIFKLDASIAWVVLMIICFIGLIISLMRGMDRDRFFREFVLLVFFSVLGFVIMRWFARVFIFQA